MTNKKNSNDTKTDDVAPAKITSEAQEECFVIMPISDHSDYDSGHFRRVYEDIFKPACLKAGYQPKRADDVKQSNLIHLDILKRVVHSPMAICDLSSRNPNVLFELGLRQAFDKPTILVKDEETPDIFDIAPIRYTIYRRNLKYREVIDDQENISLAIKSTKEAAGEKHNVQSLIRLLELTSAASITEGGTQDPNEYFQILMAEMSQIRREMKNSRSSPTESMGRSYKDGTEGVGPVLGRASRLKKRVDVIKQSILNCAPTEDLKREVLEAISLGEEAVQYYSKQNPRTEFKPRLESVLEDLARLQVWLKEIEGIDGK